MHSAARSDTLSLSLSKQQRVVHATSRPRPTHKHTTYRQSLDRAETLVLRTLRRQHGRGRTKTKIATHSSFPLRPQLRSNTAPV